MKPLVCLASRCVVADGAAIEGQKCPSVHGLQRQHGRPVIISDAVAPCQTVRSSVSANGALPVMEDVKREAQARHVELLMYPTAQAIEELAKRSMDVDAILYVTC